MTSIPPEVAKLTPIEKIQEQGKRFDSLASQRAWDAARKPADVSLRDKASQSVLRADIARQTAENVAQLIHVYWPKPVASVAQEKKSP
jgi:hypothetical protein